MNTYLESVKKERSLAVLKELCYNSNLSKTELSQKCGIGFSTIAKIISGFLDKGIVNVLYANAKHGERRTKTYGIKSSFHVMAYDISSPIFKSYIYRPGRKLKCISSNLCRSDFYFEDNFCNFCRKAKEAEADISTRKLSGELILLPGEHDKGLDVLKAPLFPDANVLPTSKIVSMLSASSNRTVGDMRQLHAAFIRERVLKDGQLTLAVFLDKTRFSSCVILHGSDSTVISDIGKNFTFDGYPLIDHTKDSHELDHFTDSIVSVLTKLHSALGFTHLYITGDYVRNMKLLSEMIYERLIENLPTVSLVSYVSTEEIINYYCMALLYKHLSDIIFPKRLTI